MQLVTIKFKEKYTILLSYTIYVFIFYIVSLCARWNIYNALSNIANVRSSPPKVLLGKGVLEIYSKFTGEHPCRSVILIKSASVILCLKTTKISIIKNVKATSIKTF